MGRDERLIRQQLRFITAKTVMRAVIILRFRLDLTAALLTMYSPQSSFVKQTIGGDGLA